MKLSLLALITGFTIDLFIGDPHGFFHPVILTGKLISFLERTLRRIFPKTAAYEKAAGAVLWLIVSSLAYFAPLAVLAFFYTLNPWFSYILESIMCWQILALKSLKDESMKVYIALKSDDIQKSRLAVSMIVGRDTKALDKYGVIRATVETIAENTSDGVIAPLLFMILGGAPAGFLYKAINTMDSMLGYTEEPYKNIGLIPAKADDAANFIPSRFSALFMLAAGGLLGLDFKNGIRIFRRDRYNHASPNSAQTESVCAGLLRIRLGGDATYHGVLHKKKYIGDALREISEEDIPVSCRLLYLTAFLAIFLLCLLKWLFILYI